MRHFKEMERYIDSNIRHLADDCIMYRKITDKKDIEKFAEGSGHPAEMGGRKWDENKSR